MAPRSSAAPSLLPLVLAGIAMLFSCAGSATAQSMLPWRNDVEKRLRALEGGGAPQRGSEVEQLRRQIADLQAALLQRGQGQPSPLPIAQIEKHYYLPPGFDPKIIIPPGFAPKIDIPPGFDPKIVIPPGFAPKQEIPPGFAPKLEIPPGFAPKLEIPPGKPLDPTPLDPAKKPMPPPPSTGLQRFTESRPPIITPSWSTVPDRRSPPVIHAIITPWKGN